MIRSPLCLVVLALTLGIHLAPLALTLWAFAADPPLWVQIPVYTLFCMQLLCWRIYRDAWRTLHGDDTKEDPR